MLGWLRRLIGDELPDDFPGTLADNEHVLAAATATQGHLVATRFGLWLPESGSTRRVDWHLISKATWDNDVLAVIEAEETAQAGESVIITDLPAKRFALKSPGKLPTIVRERVTDSIRARYRKELPGGAAWFVQRRLPGTQTEVLQVRPEPGTDDVVAAEIAREAAEQLRGESE
ncbi:hypothetical protein [Haloechinothrix salitolerans]|uniref:Uncharacterized protein n=1 Tax=Haloechinothrix salitolerans TaxID=926830 RepID=A0ABW2BXY4_9PSEU